MFRNLIEFIFIFLAIVCNAYSQSSLPNLIPASPISEDFKKFDGFKVSPYNGLPEISIPLYTIKVRGMEIPLILSYHASGIKYGQTSGEVGVGWNLNTSYRISRTIHGRPDEHYPLPENFDSLGVSPPYRDNYLAQFLSPGGPGQNPTVYSYLDGEYDLFSYSTPTDGGTFLISDRQNKTISPLELSNTKFSYTATTDSGITSVTTIDQMGNRFDFGRDFITNNRIFENSAGPSVGYKAPTAWPLMKIKTINESDEISFKYYTTLISTINNQGSFTAREAAKDSYTDYHSFTNGASDLSAYSTFFSKSIETRYEKVEIIRKPDATNRIDTIKVWTANNKMIKKIIFSYSSSGAHWFLDSLRIYGSDPGQTPQTFKFDYYNRSNVAGLIPDSWGYYTEGQPGDNFHQEFANDIIYERFLACGAPVQKTLNQVLTNGYLTNRDQSEIQHYFSLQKTTYPTGGTTEYIYEPHRYLNGFNTETKGGGIRIKKIINADSIQRNYIIRSYTYGANENGLGVPVIAGGMASRHHKDASVKLVWTIKGNAGCSSMFDVGPLQIANEYTYSVSPLGDVGSYLSMTSGNVRYPVVNEYIISENNTKAGKTTYKYDIPDDELQETGLNAAGSAGYATLFTPWKKPVLKEQETYASEGSSFILIRKDSMEYITTELASYIGLKVKPYASDDAYGAYDISYPYYSTINSWYKYSQYWISKGKKDLKHKYSFEYTPQGIVTNKESFEFNALHQIASITRTDSKGDLTTEEFTYPADYASITAPDALSQGIKKLQDLNVLASVIENRKYRLAPNGTNKRLINSSFNDHYHNQPYLAQKLLVSDRIPLTDFSVSNVVSGAVTKDNRYEREFSVDAYDNKGNVLQITGRDGIKKSYVWGYDKKYPVAEILNSAYNEIAYSETFEGPWSSPTGAILISDPDAPLNRYCMDMSGQVGVIETENINLSSNKAYVITYWEKNCELTVGWGTILSNKILQTKGNWHLRELRFTGVSGNIMLLFDPAGFIQELRLYPATARMATFTYELLIGLTSQCDANNRISYYEYDGFGRLKFIRDENKNVLKTFDYQYQKKL